MFMLDNYKLKILHQNFSKQQNEHYAVFSRNKDGFKIYFEDWNTQMIYLRTIDSIINGVYSRASPR